ncbi:wnt-binding factor required for wnt secretion domain-containing protein [Ditylenchus destructor]|uniref:Wnt-binding factor required for wnt secretion domain-containing protein n=1 Tax=Ditylenchus destructor TaxID=166010 RepID=A0AAD4N220_9BILA|nr:wnt-binding factor required for wnt secretion domain-containing protein [Ditylenchus destructor]
MSGAVIENLSNRKLFSILASLLVAQVLFFALGAVFSPDPSSSMEFLMSKCKDKNAGRNDEWFHLRPKKCEFIESLDNFKSVDEHARDIVFVAQMPHARDGVNLEYSSWFQFLIGFLEVEIEYRSNVEMAEKIPMEMEIRMAYRKQDDPVDQWTEFISTSVKRTLECNIDKHRKLEGYTYNCSAIDLFELGSNNYPFYLLNIRLPVNKTRCRSDPNAPNCAIGPINDLRLIAVHQNGGFTLIWLWLKTVVCPFVIAATWWYYNRVQALNRPKLLIEKAILALGCTLIILDLPIEWFSIWFRIPALLLISDIRQGLFYSILFSFWLIFAGEHLIDDQTRNSLKNYWRNLSFVGTASLVLLAYDLAERGRQLIDPFFSIWASDRGSFWAKLSIYVAAIAIFCYFVFLSFRIRQVWTTITRKRSAQLYAMSKTRRLKVEAIIYRFKFLMILTMVCAALTITSYLMQQYDEGHMPDDEVFQENGSLVSYASSWFTNSASAFFTGTFGMWNIYVILLLSMYAPSHKHYANAHVLEDENEDLMDPSSNTESTSMTTFFKSSTD